MALSLVTPPATEPITLTEAKLHLRVDVPDDDALITTLIQTAREHAERFTHRAFVTQTWDLTLDAFPCDGVIWLPKPPALSVTSVTYRDPAGVTQTWSAGLYTVDAPTGPTARMARIVPAYGESWPSTRAVVNAVTVRWVAGYGGATAVPESLKAALKILIGTWFDPGRASVNIGNLVTVVPHTVDALLWPYKAF